MFTFVKRNSILFFFIAAFFVFSFQSAKAADVQSNCTCFNGQANTMPDLRNDVMRLKACGIDAQAEDNCHQLCANNVRQMYIFRDNGSPKPVTKTRSSTDPCQVGTNECSCRSGAVYPTLLVNRKSVSTEQACIFMCAQALAANYLFTQNASGGEWKPVPAQQTPASTPVTPGQVPNTGITDDNIPGTITDTNGIVKCGRSGGKMCTLCDLIAGLNNVIQYVMKIAIGIGLAAFTIAGIMYIVSGGDSGMTGTAKATMKHAATGFVVIFSAWLIVNYTIMVIGTRQGMGINVTNWGQFDCSSKASQRVQQ